MALSKFIRDFNSSKGFDKFQKNKSKKFFSNPVIPSFLAGGVQQRLAGVQVPNIAQIFKSSKGAAGGIAGGAAGGSAVGSLAGQAGSTLASFPQGAGFGLGYGVGVRAGYELGFPTLFGEKDSPAREQVLKQGFSLDPSSWLDVLSGGKQMGLTVGNRLRSDIDNPPTATTVQIGDQPVTPSTSQTLSFVDEITLGGTATMPESTPIERAEKKLAQAYASLASQTAKLKGGGLTQKKKRSVDTKIRQFKGLILEYIKDIDNINRLAKNR